MGPGLPSPLTVNPFFPRRNLSLLNTATIVLVFILVAESDGQRRRTVAQRQRLHASLIGVPCLFSFAMIYNKSILVNKSSDEDSFIRQLKQEVSGPGGLRLLSLGISACSILQSGRSSPIQPLRCCFFTTEFGCIWETLHCDYLVRETRHHFLSNKCEDPKKNGSSFLTSTYLASTV